MNSSYISYRRIEQSDRIWIEKFITEHWGSNVVVVHNTSYYPGKLDGFIALRNDEKIGLITFHIQKQSCEIITLNSLIEHKGCGKELIRLVVEYAKLNGCESVWLITTNDNIRAIEFYQKFGFQLIEVFPNAVDNSRKIKPEIPLIAENGIPIRDELKFVLGTLMML